jgi:hypothetical protein
MEHSSLPAKKSPAPAGFARGRCKEVAPGKLSKGTVVNAAPLNDS